MLDAETLQLLQKLGIGGTSIAAIAFVIWQVYLKIRQQLKDDNKSDKIDERIDKYSLTLQATVDKLVTKIETLQNTNNDLVMRSAQLSADLSIAHKEAEDLKLEIQQHINRITYLEGVLKDKGISYV